MSGCTGTDKPLISILMAVYEPRMDWLKEQLDSLNRQTYPNLRLYIRDDCSPTVPFASIEAVVAACITEIPYQIARNERNLGSNLTFERLTQEAQGTYFAYCDQDDIWLPEKLAVLEEAVEESGVLLACSDMYVIDGEGNKTADSITQVRRHHVFHSGGGLARELLLHNFVTGCTMLVNGRTAKEAVPFCPYMVHDHYLALWCAEHGSVLSVDTPLIRYRIHGGNQTNVLAGVRDKKSYGEVRIRLAENRFQWLGEHFPCGPGTRMAIDRSLAWTQARWKNWNHQGGAGALWRHWDVNRIVSIAELCLKYVPDSVFMAAVRLARNNKV